MFEFGPQSLSKGGLVRIPHSLIDNSGYGEIVNVSGLGITVQYGSGSNIQTCFYRFEWLQKHYGPKKNIPSDTVLCNSCSRFARFCQCEVPDDKIPF